jgi:23S rRNA-/tRNA-specific pseudouridylate synthase
MRYVDDGEDDDLQNTYSSPDAGSNPREDLQLGLGVKQCVTEFEVISRSTIGNQQSVALVQFRPKTGRTHQVCMYVYLCL